MRKDIMQRKDEIEQWIQEERSKAYICNQLKCKQATLNSYLEKMGIQYTGQQSKKGRKQNQYMQAEVYIKNSQHVRRDYLKMKLFRDGIKERKCEICGLSEWQGRPIPLELHHKDCNGFNNELTNIQILCPNCHAQQPGNSGANKHQYEMRG